MTSSCGKLLFSLPVFLALVFFARAGEPGKAGETGPVLEKFSVAGNGDALLLPVTLKGKRHLFVLDTGSNVTLFDRSLPLGKFLDTVEANTPHGVTEVSLFEPPPSALGKLSLRPKFVASMDLKKIREVTGHAIYGIVGMDFLGQQVVRVDFASGELWFLKAAEPKMGTPLPLSYQRGCPCVSASVQGLKASFLLDTGSVGFGSGNLAADFFSTLTAKKDLLVVGKSLHETLTGTKTQRIARAGKLVVGDFSLAKPVFGEGGGNNLGLDFLSRFVVTLDFPNDRIFLQKGKRFEHPDVWDVSGLHIIRKKGKTWVHSVDKDSPAGDAGVKAGDRIVKVGDRLAEEMTLFQIRRLGCARDSLLRLTIGRQKETREVALDLKKKIVKDAK